jgi:hypothetical protein
MDNTINSLVSKTVGVTDQQIRDFLANSPTDAQIVAAMEQFGVSPTQLSSVVGMPEGQVVARIAATIPQGQSVIVGDTRVAPQYQTSGSGMDQQVGGLENVYVEKVPTSDVNYKSPVGTQIQVYSPTGEFVNTIKTKEDLSFFGGLKEALTDPVVLAALGGAAYGGLLGGAGAATGAGSAFEALNAGAGAFGGSSSLGSLGALGADYGLGTGSSVAGMGTGTGILPGTSGLGFGTADAANLASMGGGQGLTTTAMGGGTLGQLGTNLGATGLGNLNLGATNVGLGTSNAGLTGLGSTNLGSALTGGLGAGLTNTGILQGQGLGTTLLGTGTGVGSTGLNTGVGTATTLGGNVLGGTGTNVGNVANTALGTALGTGAGTALGTTLGQGLTLSALGTGLGGIANQAGISDARNLINQYGTQAQGSLAEAYKNAQSLNVANRADLGNVYSNASTVLNDLYNKQVGYQQPYQDIGQAGSQGLLANQDYLTRQFTNADLNANLAPNYAFQLAQGQMANQRAANMGGGSLGGNVLTGLQRYTQDYAGNAYQNAFNNFNTQRQNIYGNLSNMANIGTTSAGQLANLGSSLGGVYGNLSSGYGGNLTTAAGQGINAANQYGLNTAGLATGIGGALASNAAQTGANNATMLSNLGNTALLGSMLRAT